ncbi:MAG: hypothetical protein HFE79_01305 [Ruminiclostridium sp.]|nr:hypothetical protein [Ruminiclostridium sp.]
MQKRKALSVALLVLSLFTRRFFVSVNPPAFTSRPSPPKRLKINKALCMELDFLHPLDDLKSASPTILKILAQLFNLLIRFFALPQAIFFFRAA